MARVTSEKLVSDVTTTSADVATSFTTVTYEKLVSDASTSQASEGTDIVYETRSYRKLVSPATTVVTDIEAEYKTATKRKLVKKGGFSEWREIVCDADVTTDLIKRVQRALLDRGYDVGPAGVDNIIGRDTKAALTKFQKDNELPLDSLDFETLKALGVK